MNRVEVEEKLILDDAFFAYVHIYTQKIDALPNNEHYGTFIEYQDIRELRQDFLRALIDTICDWVYSQEKYKDLIEREMKSGKSNAAAASAVNRKVREKFRGKDNDNLLSQGQFGELLLFHYIQHCFKAMPILRKMRITTSSKQERFGADAIHYTVENNKNIIIIGEAKAYTKGTFNAAFKKAAESILSSYENLRSELNLYVHEDFLDEEMNQVAEDYLNNKLSNVENRLVCIVAYNENKDLVLENEHDIKNQIKRIIEDKIKNASFGDSVSNNPMINRITYIVFPIWKMEDLIQDFQKEL